MSLEQAGTVEVVADTPAPTEAQSEDAVLAATFDRLVTNNGADRGEGGKFTTPDGKEAPVGGEAEAGGEQGVDRAPPSPAATPAPAHLPQNIKGLWDGMSEDARKAWAAHVTETDRKFGEQGKVLGQIKPFHDEFAAAMSKFPEFKSLTPTEMAAGAVRLAGVQLAMNKNPVGTILEVAKQFNVMDKLAQVFGGQGKPAAPGDQGQLVASLERKIAGLEAELKASSNPEKLRETVSATIDQKMKWNEAASAFAEWSKDLPHYADVEATLPTFVKMVIEQKGLARPPKEILAEAYDMAINANPEVRAKVRAAEATATAANQDPKRAEAAKKAASINVKPSATGKERVLTEDEILAATYDRVRAAS
jgi:hypothetical protein